MTDGSGWAVWFVGLPGSGKSAQAKNAFNELEKRGLDVVWLQMDERRKAYFPEPAYTAEEREEAYRLFAEEAAGLARQGRGVLMDGSAYKASMRRYARSLIPRFAEVHIACDLDEAIRRETGRAHKLVMARMYEKALDRKKTGRQYEGLGEVIGVDVPFETDPEAELIIDNTNLPKAETMARVMAFMDRFLGG